MKIKKIIPLMALAALLSIVRCSDEDTSKPVINPNAEIEALLKRGGSLESSGSTSGRVQVDGCGSYFSGSSSTSGYYTYPDRTITLCATAGGTITISCTAIEVPNRFTVYDGSGNFIGTTGWIGYSSNPGPWGSSLNGPSSKSISFTKSTATTYKLRVETVVQGISDAWDASVGCSNVCPPCPNSCGTFQSGSQSASGYYVYPDKTLTFCTAQNGKTITVNCSANDTPNRFNIYSPGGSLIATTGWIGWSSNPGPWGSSLNGPSTKSMSFVKSSSFSNYYIRVETVVQGLSDAWDTSVGCQP